MATRIVFVGDIHAADRPPLGRTEDYREQILTKLEEGGVASKGADAIVLLGDIFHQPRANLVSHSLVKSLMDIFRRYPAPVYALMGNHDQGEEGYASLPRQPFGVLGEAGVIRVFLSPVVVGQVRLVFRHYDARRDADPTYYALGEDERDRPFNPGAIILCAHGSIVPPGESRPYPTLNVRELLYCGADAIISGHLHEDLGISKVSYKGNHLLFANPGSLARVSRDKHNMTRIPHILVADWDGKLTFSYYELESARPASEVFLTPEAGGEEGVSDEIREFARALSGGLAAEEADLDTLLAKFSEIPTNVRNHVRRLIENAGGF